MGKFSLRNFVMDTIRRMISGGEVNYIAMRYAAGWYEKEVLLDEDMMEISALIDARDGAAEEIAPDDVESIPEV